MEIQAYIKFLQHRWKTILLFTALTLGATAAWTMNMQPTYESTTTYVVRISSSSDEKNQISALNTLMSSDDIPATYAKVANSRLIKRQAAEQLQLSSSQRSGLSSDSQLIAGTNVLEVTARGNDPTLVMNYANAVGQQMVAYAATLYDTFELVALDDATLPRSPTQPNMNTNLLLGGVLGLLLGLGVGLLREYLQTSNPLINGVSLPGNQPDLLDLPQFLEILEKEIAASRVSHRPLAVALLDIAVSGAKNSATQQPQDAVRQAGSHLIGQLQINDRVGFFDSDTLVFLLPDTSKALANAKFNQWQQALKGLRFDGSAQGKARVNCSGVVVAYPEDIEDEYPSADQLLLEAKSRLNQPAAGRDNKTGTDHNSVVTVP